MRLLFTILILVLTATIGCGGGDDGGGSSGDTSACGCEDGCGCAEEEEEADAGGGGTFTPDKGTATVKGVVKFEGTAPRRRKIDLGAEEFCVQYHKEPVRSEAYIVGADGGLANVFVHVKSGLKGWKFEKASGEVVLDQVGCQYLPHVVGMRAGQTLVAHNGDPLMHNVHGFWMHNDDEVFNWAQAKKGLSSKMLIRKPGFIRVKCDVHGWMSSYVCITRYPFFAVTDESGAYTLPKLPAGKYTLEAWHEKLGTKSVAVTVADGGSADANFTFAK